MVLVMSETRFRNILKDREFAVNEKHENENGVDIVAVKNGHYFLIEVVGVVKEKGIPRIRTNKCKDEAEFIIVSTTEYFYPLPIAGKPLSKLVLFMETLNG